MTEKEKPVTKGVNGSGDVQVTTVGNNGVYDPSKESVFTRLGLTFESFKPAPGSTAGQVVHGQHNAGDIELDRKSPSRCRRRAPCNFVFRLLKHGGCQLKSFHALSFLPHRSTEPMLQQSMKNR